MGPGALSEMLGTFEGMFRPEEHPELLVGLDSADDAAVYKISDDIAVIFTVDFLTPVVDDPFTYGAIAAANSMSDVYAMGGRVVLALNVASFPDDLPVEIPGAILRGGAEKIAEAGAVLAGGHTLMDKEPKYGLAVMGLVHPDRILTKGNANPGDALLLGKPVGTGIITSAAVGEVAEDEHILAATDSMLHLNERASIIAIECEATSCTDVTGFGLIGHALEIAEHSDVCLRICTENLPFLPGSREYADRWLFPGGTCRNIDAYLPRVTVETGIEEELVRLLHTPETSGGLLITIPDNQLQIAMELASKHGESLFHIGNVEEGAGVLLE